MHSSLLENQKKKRDKEGPIMHLILPTFLPSSVYQKKTGANTGSKSIAEVPVRGESK